MPQPPQNSVLTTLAGSSHAWVQLATVALVAVSGFSNWFATNNSAARSQAELEMNRRATNESEARIKAEVARQVADIHSWLTQATDEFHQGNADSAANRKTLLELVAAQQDNITQFETRVTALLTNQGSILKNQTELLQGQNRLLQGLKKEERP
jgi:hypothetical protein